MFAPPPSRPFRIGWHLTYEGRLWFLLVLICEIVGFYKGIALLNFIAHILLVCLLIGAWRLKSRLDKLKPRRTFDEFVTAGRPAAATLSVENTGAQPIGGLVFHETFMAIPARGMDVGAGKIAEIALTYYFPYAGRYQLGPIWLRSHFPFGLIGRDLLHDLPLEVIALPRLGRIDIAALLELVGDREMLRADSRRRTSMPGHEEFRGLRAYRPGDSPRGIHWRSSARRGELLVREEAALSGRQLNLVFPLAYVGLSVAARDSWLSLLATVISTWLEPDETRLRLLLWKDGKLWVMREGSSRHRRDFLTDLLKAIDGTSASERTQPATGLGRSKSLFILPAEYPTCLPIPSSEVATLRSDNFPNWYTPPTITLDLERHG